MVGVSRDSISVGACLPATESIIGRRQVTVTGKLNQLWQSHLARLGGYGCEAGFKAHCPSDSYWDESATFAGSTNIKVKGA